jgi:hypothetical protein
MIHPWAALFLSLCLGSCVAPQRPLDLVLAGGRLIDPETGGDGIRNVGVRGDTIVQINIEPTERQPSDRCPRTDCRGRGARSARSPI